MKRNRKYIFSKSPIAAVLFLYVPFLLVQGFFNYYGPLHQHNHTENVQYHKAIQPLNGTAIQAEKNAGNLSSGIRLNKRFQPANIAFCLPVSFEIPFCNEPVKSFGNYLNPSLASSHLLTYSLRGPPAVA